MSYKEWAKKYGYIRSDIRRVCEEAFQAGAASRDAYIEQLELALLQVRKAICGDIHNTDDLLDLIASRGAEVARLREINSKLCEKSNWYVVHTARLEEERDKLRAQINVLREELGKHVTELMNISVSNGANSVSMPDDYVATALLLSETPEQSLAEYRNKVIDDVERYRWLRGYMASERTDLDDEIVEACSTDKPEKLDAFIDTAIRAMKEQP